MLLFSILHTNNSTVFIVCSSISPERTGKGRKENTVFIDSQLQLVVSSCTAVPYNLPWDNTRILPQCRRRCRYTNTHINLLVYTCFDFCHFFHKNFQKNICTGNIFSTRQMSSSSNTKSKKDLFFLVHLSNWCTWNCSGRGRGNPT